MYAILALLGVDSGGRTDEASVECLDVDEVCSRVRELVAAKPGFHAITVVHVEDLPASLEGAREASI